MNPKRAPIRCSADLLETVVLRIIEERAKKGDRAAYEAYRGAADRIYARYHDPESRRIAFQALYAGLLDDLGFARTIGDALERRGLRFEAVLITRAWSPAEEEASLSADGRTLGLRLMVDRFGSPEFVPILEHELGHVLDMVDSSFGYGLARAALGPARRRTEERFGLLWDCVVDGRTARLGRQPLATRTERIAQFEQLFPELSLDATAVVGTLWDGARPTYAELVSFTRDYQALVAWCGLPVAVVAASAQSAGWAVPVPGAPCPLCGFPTFAWERTIPERIAARITADFPNWTPARGACERCVEGYAAQSDPLPLLR